MADVRIKTFKDGPYEVKGTVKLVDPAVGEFALKEDRIYLCRCGRSKNKPFCDGSHSETGFKAEDGAR